MKKKMRKKSRVRKKNRMSNQRGSQHWPPTSGVQSEKALAAYNSGQVKKKCFRCGQWGHISRMCPQIKATGGGNQHGQGRYSQGPGGPMNQWNSRPTSKKDISPMES